MRKRLIKLLIVFAAIFLIAYVGINLLLEPASREAMNFAIENLQISNFSLSEPSFSAVNISSYNSITWEKFFLTATVKTQEFSKRTLVFSVKARELTVEMAKPFKGLFVTHLKGLDISQYLPNENGGRDAGDHNSDSAQDDSEAVREGSLAVPIRLNVMSLSDSAARIRIFASEIKKFLAQGKTLIPIQFSGEEIFTIKGSAYAVKFWVEQRGEEYRLVADKEDLKPVAAKVLPRTEVPTPADIGVIAENPVKAPMLLRLSSKSTDTAAAAHKQNPIVPEDAYRHVLWSFLLTREYGPDFAKEVTDAHEMTNDPEEKNDPHAEADHRQDYNNNEIGRIYAARGYRESDILSHVMTDPKVIRQIGN